MDTELHFLANSVGLRRLGKCADEFFLNLKDTKQHGVTGNRVTERFIIRASHVIITVAK